ncbi:hypothetical protein BGW80DRAFT_1355671 [Lactifluus volemus]|nr:hypothetical protein BGW80DRAFT_1355671 [Lactifluus volemus]
MPDVHSLLPLIPHPFQGNKSFIAFSNLGDADTLTKTWEGLHQSGWLKASVLRSSPSEFHGRR